MVRMVIFLFQVSFAIVAYVFFALIKAFEWIGGLVVIILEYTVGRLVPTIVLIAVVGVPAYLLCLVGLIAWVVYIFCTGQMAPPVLAESLLLSNACLAVIIVACVCRWLAFSQACWYGYLGERYDNNKTSPQKYMAHRKRLYGNTFTLMNGWPRPLQYIARAGFSL